MAEPVLRAELGIRVGSGAHVFQIEAQLELTRGVLVLFGPSGSGKSLTLQALAGLITPERGSIRVAGELLFDGQRRLAIPTERRRIGYVPQRSSLFPFCNVRANVAFGLPAAERRERSPAVARLLDEFGLTALAEASPGSLSGGEAQRVALARALAVGPRLVLMDEPFASIDRPARRELREVVRSMLDRHGTPAVIVTHDPEDALALGDTVVCFERGRTTRCGSPQELLAQSDPVLLSGSVERVERSPETGRAVLRLSSAVIEGPERLLDQLSGGELRVSLESERPSRSSGDDEPGGAGSGPPD